MLSDFQGMVLFMMKREKLILCTSEGKDYRCWLENQDGVIVKRLRKDTSQILAKENKIRLMPNNEYPQRYKNTDNIFCWTVS